MTIDFEAPEVKAAVNAAAEKIAQEKVEAETGGLKKKQVELLDELKELKRKYDGIDPEEHKALKKGKRDADDKDSDPVKLRERIEGELTPKVTAAEKRAAEAEAKLSARIIDGDLTSALLEAGVAKEFLPAAKALLQSSRKVEVTDGGAIVDGKPASEFVKGWAAADGKPFIAARDNNGGGGKGGAGGGASGKKASEMTPAEKATYMREHGLEAWQAKVNKES